MSTEFMEVQAACTKLYLKRSGSQLCIAILYFFKNSYLLGIRALWGKIE